MTQQQPAPLEPNALRDAAMRMAQALDSGLAPQMWDGASPAMKRAVTREAFVAAMAGKRKAAEGPSRRWKSIEMVRVNASEKAPAGHYANVVLEAVDTKKAAFNELVTFRFDEDGTWRLVGFSSN